MEHLPKVLELQKILEDTNIKSLQELNQYADNQIRFTYLLADDWGVFASNLYVQNKTKTRYLEDLQTESTNLRTRMEEMQKAHSSMQTFLNSLTENKNNHFMINTVSFNDFVMLSWSIWKMWEDDLKTKQHILDTFDDYRNKLTEKTMDIQKYREDMLYYLSAWQMQPQIDKSQVNLFKAFAELMLEGYQAPKS